MQKIKVLLVEDHAIVRKGLRMLLELESDMEVVGEATDGREALKMAEDLHPDVVVMDIAMPGLNGLEASRQLMKRFPRLKIIILTVFATEEYVLQALQAGVSGYLLKSAMPADLVTAIRCVMQGESYLSPSISKKVIDEYIRSTQKMSKKEQSPQLILSPREREVLQLLAEGRTTRQIADLLFIGMKTVEAHKAHLKEKLNISHTAGLIEYALRKGLIIKET